MKITAFAQKVVAKIDSGLKQLEKKELSQSTKQKLQNVIIMLGNSLIEDVNPGNAEILKEKVKQHIRSNKIDEYPNGFPTIYIDLAFDELGRELRGIYI